jgi:hypothetical protein
MPTLENDSGASPLTGTFLRQESIAYLALAVVLSAMAGGMGWGIRGQYGHETGAMIAGVLVGFTLALLFMPHASSLKAARVVALVAVGISFGGSMTYGQTIGLTQNGAMIGNWAALRWGLLGLFIKGGIWIGFAGALLGVGLSDKRYRPMEMTLLLVVMLVLFFIGMRMLNGPFDPANKVLPQVYFSADWYWEPGAELKPRPECWGGLLFALVGLTVYLGGVRRDRLARNMALTGMLAGGLGFSLGQSVQAFHAWNRELFKAGLLGKLDPYMNWWNMMEISFGAIAAGLLAAGLWLNRRKIVQNAPRDEVVISPLWEFVLFAAHLSLLVNAEFVGIPVLVLFLQFGLLMAVFPFLGILGGRYWPYLFALPIVAVPIVGKTLRELAYNHAELSKPAGWILYVVIPLAVTLAAALWLAHRGEEGQTSRPFARIGLLLTTWLYFGLNFAFFRIPWPWREWTGRTPSGILFTVCAVTLTLAAVFFGLRPRQLTAEVDVK